MSKPLDLNSENIVMELNDMLQNEAKSSLSFFGNRIVELKFVTRRQCRFTQNERMIILDLDTQVVSLDELARKVLSKRCQFEGKGSFNTPSDCKKYREVVEKLKEFYKDSDAAFKNSNFITKILTWIREFSFLGVSTRDRVVNE